MGAKYRLGAVSEFPPGSAHELVAGDRIVALYHIDGEFYALDGVCPHAGGPLGQGGLTGNVVTCPWHGWQFDVTTGQHCLNPLLKQPRFPVEVVEGEVWVEIP